jgi:hypothetical protein
MCNTLSVTYAKYIITVFQLYLSTSLCTGDVEGVKDVRWHVRMDCGPRNRRESAQLIQEYQYSDHEGGYLQGLVPGLVHVTVSEHLLDLSTYVLP